MLSFRAGFLQRAGNPGLFRFVNMGSPFCGGKLWPGVVLSARCGSLVRCGLLFSFHENKKLRASAPWRFMAENFYASELATAISFEVWVFLFSFHENKKLRAFSLWRWRRKKFLASELATKFFRHKSPQLQTFSLEIQHTFYVIVVYLPHESQSMTQSYHKSIPRIITGNAAECLSAFRHDTKI